jgi:hypothetical protein
MDAYGAVQCVFCDAQWTSAFDGDWECPCGKCHSDYRAAYETRTTAAAVPSKEPEDPDMVWYEAKKKEWLAYAKELEEEDDKED